MVLVLILFWGGGLIDLAASEINVVPEEVSVSSETNYGYNVKTALDASGSQYVFSSSTLFKKESSGWSSHPVSPKGYNIYSVIPDQSGIVHLLFQGGENFYYSECSSILPDGEACPTGEVIGPFSPYFMQSAAMVMDSNGTLHIVYSLGADIFYRMRVQGESSWTEPVAIFSYSGGMGLTPNGFSMRVDPDGRTLHLAGGNYYATFMIYYGKRTPDGTWTFETIPTEGAIWGRVGLALEGSNPRICYGSGKDFNYGPLVLTSRSSDGAWSTEVLAQSYDLNSYERGYSADCDIFGNTLYVITTIGKCSGSSSSDEFDPHVITKALPDGDPVYHGTLGNTYGFNGDIAMAVGARVSVAWTLTPIAAGYNGYIFAVHDLSAAISGNNAPMATDDSYVTNEEQALIVAAPGVLTNDTDADGDLLTAVLVTGPANGALTPNADGSFVYVPNPNFNGTDSFTYKANDGIADSNIASVSITVHPVNKAPIANAGSDQTVHPGIDVTLDGTGSYDPDENYDLTYSWNMTSKPSGSSAFLTNPNTPTPSFTVDDLGDYIIELVVTDSNGLSSSADQVLISTSNSSPVADTGEDQAIIEIGIEVILGADPLRQSYDDDGDLLTYVWTMTYRPEGSNAYLSDPTSATPTFIADIHGDYLIELVVSDPWISSEPDTVKVSFNNVAPVSVPESDPPSVIQGETVNLYGTNSYDNNKDFLYYNWNIVSKPLNSITNINNPTNVQTSFLADVPGDYTVSLVVNDGLVNSPTETITICAISVQDACTKTLQDTTTAVNNLDPYVFINEKMQNPLTNKINSALKLVDQGNYQEALDKLEYDILSKTNGCAETGAPDKNDWIKDCESQASVYPLIIDTIEYLKNLQ